MTTTETPGALAAARAVLADLAAKSRAICATCAGIVAAGTGELDGEPDLADQQLDALRAERGRAPLAGWMRRHSGCGTPSGALRDLIGVRADDELAAAALVQLGRPLAAEANATKFDMLDGWRGKPWAHVTKAERSQLREALELAERERRIATEPHSCFSGACGACGVRLSLRWYESPIRWRDGAEAPWCADCGAIARRRPRTADVLELRALAVEAYVGVDSMVTAAALSPRVRLFAEVADPGDGTDERWAYAVDAWEAVRDLARRQYPEALTDPDERDHWTRLAYAAADATRAREHEAATAAARAEALELGWPAP